MAVRGRVLAATLVAAALTATVAAGAAPSGVAGGRRALRGMPLTVGRDLPGTRARTAAPTAASSYLRSRGTFPNWFRMGGPAVRRALEAPAGSPATTLPSPLGAAARAAAGRPPRAVSGAAAWPMLVSGFPGVFTQGVTPSDSTGADGPGGYLEAVNTEVALFPPGSATAAATTPLGSMVGDPAANSASLCITDPQVIWDQASGRYYVVALDCNTSQLFYAYSTTSAPQGLPSAGGGASAGWCTGYFVQYAPQVAGGQALPDYPKLGDTQDFLLIGVNVFEFDANGDELGVHADVNAVPKPPAGPTCASAQDMTASATRFSDLQASANSLGITQAFTPVPAVQADPSPTGYVVASQQTPDATSEGDVVDVYTATEGPGGSSISLSPAAGVKVQASPWSQQAPAPQRGATVRLDTLDPRLTNAWLAPDPSHGGVPALWTQHTVAGGAGSTVAWYEISPTASPGPAVLQGGVVAGSRLWAFNGAIAPDRTLAGGGAFGDSMVLTFTASSSTMYPSMEMVAKVGSAPRSAWVTARAGTGPEYDFSCFDLLAPSCRWGDYSGASPDPTVSPAGGHGRVVVVGMYSVLTRNGQGTDWRTWIEEVSPAPPTAVLAAPSAVFQTTSTIGVGWTGAEGAGTYTLRWDRAPAGGGFGAFTVKPEGAGTSDVLAGASSGTYCFSVQAADAAGFAGPWSQADCTAVPLDDRGLRRSGAWYAKSGSGWYGGTYLAGWRHGGTLTAWVQARQLALIVGRCPSCGSVEISFGGVRPKVVSLAGAAAQEVVLRLWTFRRVLSGTVTVTIVSSGREVQIDGLGVSRA